MATSITAFVGSAPSGPLDTPVRLREPAEYDRTFGGLCRSSPMSYALHHFFQNGGGDALVVRVANGDDGAVITDAQVSAADLRAPKRGIWALENEPLFDLLCVPPFSFGDGGESGDVGAQTRAAAADYCKQRRAMFIVDPLSAWREPSDITTGPRGLDSSEWGLATSENAALYFPRLSAPDPLQEGRLATFAPCGAVAGMIARTDAEHGVWKAPAGRDATLRGVSEFTVKLTDAQIGLLNPLGVNCLRALPGVGCVAWGARTLLGTGSLASEWKYLPIRRLALLIEENLLHGTQWAALEPNDESLWTQLRLNLDAFMRELFRQGAFQGNSPHEAYFVRCGRDTTSQSDIDLGTVNIVVGFAPLKPAEFVLLQLRLTAGRIAS